MSTAFLVKRRGAALLGGLDAAVRRHPADQARLVTFHAVGNRVDGDVHGIYDLTPAEFARHVDAVVGAAEETGLPFRSLAEWPAPGIVVTFDDGYADLVGTVAPVLSDRGIPFHCFVTGDRLDAGDPRYLDRAALTELASVPLAGIGAHGWRHSPLDAMQADERDNDLLASRSSLEDLLVEHHGALIGVAETNSPLFVTHTSTNHQLSTANYQSIPLSSPSASVPP